ncbi:MAG TPA: cytochrome d ubiquinol oxidase subunit II, partial [Microbacterium sp.]|nr:cytochrome d ubiquinol oxidase subunit II [Microbacterium sp.]
VAIEFRGKVHDPRWARFWTWCLGLGSAVSAFCIGAALAITSTGLPIDANGDRVGGPFVWLTLPAVLGGVAVVCFSLAHGSAFLALKTDGEIREKTGRFSGTWGPVLLLPAAAWALWVQFAHGGGWWLSWTLVALAVASAVHAWFYARRGKEGMAFAGYIGFIVFGAGSIFAGMFPQVLPSTLDDAFSLTVTNAANSSYTLMVMTVVAAFGLPLVIAYQAWSYWVFRKRLTPGMIPEPHIVIPAILRAK